jgi:hypothetical protein
VALWLREGARGGAGGPRQQVRGLQDVVGVSAPSPAAAVEVLLTLRQRGLLIYEGVPSFATEISCNYRDSPYKGDWRRQNDGRPSSKPAAASAGPLSVRLYLG